MRPGPRGRDPRSLTPRIPASPGRAALGRGAPAAGLGRSPGGGRKGGRGGWEWRSGRARRGGARRRGAPGRDRGLTYSSRYSSIPLQHCNQHGRNFADFLFHFSTGIYITCISPVRAGKVYFSLSLSLSLTLMGGSHHLISQAGWNRCNLSIYLSIYRSLAANPTAFGLCARP